MHACVWVCVCTYVWMDVCLYACNCLFTYIYRHIQRRAHTHTVCIYLYMHTITYIHTYILSHVLTYITLHHITVHYIALHHITLHSYIHGCMHTHKHKTYTYVYTYRYMQAWIIISRRRLLLPVAPLKPGAPDAKISMLLLGSTWVRLRSLDLATRKRVMVILLLSRLQRAKSTSGKELTGGPKGLFGV